MLHIPRMSALLLTVEEHTEIISKVQTKEERRGKKILVNFQILVDNMHFEMTENRSYTLKVTIFFRQQLLSPGSRVSNIRS